MKFTNQIVVVAFAMGLFGCGFNTGLDPIDKLADPPKSLTQNFRFVNKSSEKLEVQAKLYETSSSNRCSPYYSEDKTELSPGETKTLTFIVKCRVLSLRRVIMVTKPGNFSTGLVDLHSQENVDKLSLGTKLQATDARTAKVTNITIAEKFPTTAHSIPWPSSSVIAPGVAWIAGTALYVAGDISNGDTQIAFPKSLGIRDLGNYTSVTEESESYVTQFASKPGLTIYPESMGENTQVICSQNGCTSSAY